MESSSFLTVNSSLFTLLHIGGAGWDEVLLLGAAIVGAFIFVRFASREEGGPDQKPGE